MSERRPKIVHDDHLVLAEHMIKDNEDLCLELYHDSLGNLTGGYGHNMEGGIPIEAANLLLDLDIREAVTELAKYGFYDKLSDIRKAVVIDMMLNMGAESFSTFRKMIRALALENHDEAAKQIRQSKYFLQVKSRGKRNYCMMKFNTWWNRQNSEDYFRTHD